MRIIEDVNNKEGKHEIKHRYFKRNGHELYRVPLPVGDYIAVNDRVLDALRRKRSRGLMIKKMDLMGTYNVSVDSKQDIEELYSNLVQSHERFRDELVLASNNGIRLVILVENRDGVRHYKEIFKWKNEKGWKRYFRARKRAETMCRKPPRPPVKPTQLMKMMHTMMEKYPGVEFQFCKPEEAGERIVQILKGEK